MTDTSTHEIIQPIHGVKIKSHIVHGTVLFGKGSEVCLGKNFVSAGGK